VEKYGRVRQATDDNTIRRMRFACWITKATDTHSEYVILIAFPRQQWLCKRVSMLRYTCIAWLVHTCTLLCAYPYTGYTIIPTVSLLKPITRTTCSNVNTLRILATQRIYEFRVILTLKAICFPKDHLLTALHNGHCVQCEV
jgi:hypothetical protein